MSLAQLPRHSTDPDSFGWPDRAAFRQVSPEINGMLHLSVFPNDEYRETVLFLVCMSIAGTFIWDRLCLLLFGV